MVSQLIQGSQTMVAEPEEYTPRSRRILEIANREAMRFRASAIGTEHLLIAILRETDCVAAQLLYSWCAGPEGLSGYCTWYRYGCQGSEGRYAVGQGQVAEKE